MLNRTGKVIRYTQPVYENLTGLLCEIYMPASGLGKSKGFESHPDYMFKGWDPGWEEKSLVALYHKIGEKACWLSRGSVLVEEPVLILEPILVFTPANRQTKDAMLGAKVFHRNHGPLFNFWHYPWPEIREATV